MAKITRGGDQAKKMPHLERQSSKKDAGSAALKEYLSESEPYKEFLVTGHRSNPQRPIQLGQFVRDWDRVWDRAGRGENGTGGKLIFCS